MKEFVVIGLGNFGATVARELARLKCRVTAIDADRERVRKIQEEVAQAIIADATEREFLERLEVEKYNSFIVSTGEDSHASILIVLHLKELGAEKIIVKAKTENHAKILLKVGATQALIPEKQMASKIAHSMAESNLIDFLPLSDEYYIAEIPPPKRFIDGSLSELKVRAKYGIQVIAVKNIQSGEFEFVPEADYRIKSSDILVVLGRGVDIEKLR